MALHFAAKAKVNAGKGLQRATAGTEGKSDKVGLTQWDLTLAQALLQEGTGGYAALQAEGLAGAARFAGGAGRHGQPAGGA